MMLQVVLRFSYVNKNCPRTMYSLDFINIGCNRVAGCSHWGRNGLLAYGAGKFAAIMDVEKNILLNTLPGHSGRVNSLRWIPPVSSGMMGFAVFTKKDILRDCLRVRMNLSLCALVVTLLFGKKKRK